MDRIGAGLKERFTKASTFNLWVWQSPDDICIVDMQDSLSFSTSDFWRNINIWPFKADWVDVVMFVC